MQSLLSEVKQCQVCEKYLPAGCRPVVSASPKSKILIIGQAPGRKVHESGIPWDDQSGDNLRKWLGVSKEAFYNSDIFGIIPMGFCYPGTGKSGDLPPRPECAPLWHEKLLSEMNDVRLTLLFGQYAIKHYLGKSAKPTLTETVKNHKVYLPDYLPLPHPSPRNNIWMKKNGWFGEEILPIIKEIVRPFL